MSDPTRSQAPFGDFPEANTLLLRYTTTLDDMVKLLSTVKAAIAFAGQVTDVVADSYEASDKRAALDVRSTS
ncbi:hypothetical protein ACQP2F_15615 [Actinoplanes sp. CA-030573]|uniref:hypothetical protein n=1 Tax=Actinoplanes sp. CA-030573 TaxID=3239898 RepID=UPI003D9383A0